MCCIIPVNSARLNPSSQLIFWPNPNSQLICWSQFPINFKPKSQFPVNFSGQSQFPVKGHQDPHTTQTYKTLEGSFSYQRIWQGGVTPVLPPWPTFCPGNVRPFTYNGGWDWIAKFMYNWIGKWPLQVFVHILESVNISFHVWCAWDPLIDFVRRIPGLTGYLWLTRLPGQFLHLYNHWLIYPKGVH